MDSKATHLVVMVACYCKSFLQRWDTAESCHACFANDSELRTKLFGRLHILFCFHGIPQDVRFNYSYFRYFLEKCVDMTLLPLCRH